ncbi:BIR-domain-containing protein [Ceraceosorus guamensis]|uniref:BIR-domain-containing protein n=1 Tax=Ceraceosorus guamensis TaxID=1522189 RepID=A0A316VVJ3_9BASI|nr:BIR-domain-containing protein [Ceraceosorus guamensis]PWN40331.1 BIR-domain-containing protein [Ceraceosorus guamensis]
MEMLSHEARRATFDDEGASARAGSRAASGTSKRKGATGSSAALTWPHTGKSKYPSPSQLAAAGFHFSPTHSSPDRCLHIFCDAAVEDWKEGEEALDRLMEMMADCPFAKIVLSAREADKGNKLWRESEENVELLPSSNEMYEARKATFGDAWPHDGKRGWKPTSAKLAKAGFHFTPAPDEEDEADRATCIYCDRALGGWEKADDPIEEHRRREPECPYFTATLLPVDTSEVDVATESASRRKVAASKKTTRSDQVEEDVIANVDTAESAVDTDSEVPRRRTGRKKTVAEAAEAPSAPSIAKSKVARSVSRKGTRAARGHGAADEEEQDDGEGVAVNAQETTEREPTQKYTKEAPSLARSVRGRTEAAKVEAGEEALMDTDKQSSKHASAHTGKAAQSGANASVPSARTRGKAHAGTEEASADEVKSGSMPSDTTSKAIALNVPSDTPARVTRSASGVTKPSRRSLESAASLAATEGPGAVPLSPDAIGRKTKAAKDEPCRERHDDDEEAVPLESLTEKELELAAQAGKKAAKPQRSVSSLRSKAQVDQENTPRAMKSSQRSASKAEAARLETGELQASDRKFASIPRRSPFASLSRQNEQSKQMNLDVESDTWRTALKKLEQLPTLMPEDENLTVDEWLNRQMQAAIEELKAEGQMKVEALKKRIEEQRRITELILRGQVPAAAGS